MRVLMLSRFHYSGVMSHILSLAAGLSRMGVKAVVIITDCPSAYQEQLRRRQQYFPCFAESRPENILRLARHYRFDLLHLHDPSLAKMAQRLLHALRIPCVVTLHGELGPAVNLSLLPGLSYVITPYPAARGIPPGLHQKLVFIPEGVDLETYRPAPKEGFKVTFIGEKGGFTEEGATALLKAAGLADLELELICPQPLPLLKGRFHGWQLNSSHVLSGSQVVVGRFRGLLEGMACGNAALIMGRSYRGMFNPSQYSPGLPFPEISGEGEEPPCYRSIFFDLSSLLKDRGLLESMQQQGRKFVQENCNLRLVAEQTFRLYRHAAGK
ncbi:MAG: glycosyltransferase family 4 protein [Dethiobacteria bacterium]